MSKLINENSIVNLVTFGPFLFIPAVILLFSLIIIDASNTSFEKSVEKLEENLHRTHANSIRTKVKSVVDDIVYHKSIIEDEMKNRIQMRVNNAIKMADAIYEKYKDTKSKKEIQELIIELLRPLIWNKGESFIWIMDYDGVFYLAPEYLRHLEGKSIIGFKDASGKEVIKEEIKICKNEGSGFLWDTFTRPNKGKDQQYQQLAFVKRFDHYNWYMGSSEYLDTAKKHADELLLNSIRSRDLMHSDYIYIVNKDGEVILHSAIEEFVGENMQTYNNGQAKHVYEAIKEGLKNKKSAYIEYDWYNHNNNKYEKKYSYLEKVPGSDWIVATGYYESDIQDTVAHESNTLYETHYMKLTNIIYGSIFLLLSSLFVSYLVSRLIKKAFSKYHKQINLKATELKHLNISLESKVQERTEQLLKATKELEEIAKTDFLTKAHNRYSIMEILEHEITRCKRYNTTLSLAMIDVDWFKSVNDEYGHGQGDSVLIEMVKLFKRNLRNIDYVGRYGGEEFLLILPDTLLEDAKVTITRMMKSVSEFNFGIEKKLTISAGLVEYEQNDTMDEMLKKVDDLLYESKQNGRNLLSVQKVKENI